MRHRDRQPYAPTGRRRRITGWDVSVLVAANAVVVVGLWWRQGGIREIHDVAGLLTSLGRVTGLLGAYLALVELLLLARIPVLDAVGLERMSRWHRRQRHRLPDAAARSHRAHHGRLRARRRRHADPRDGRPAHALLGRAAGHHRPRPAGGGRRQLGRGRPPPALLPHVARAARLGLPRDRAGLQPSARHRPGVPGPARRSRVLVGAVRRRRGALVGLRVVLPVARSFRHRLRIERVLPEAPGIVSVEIGAWGSSACRCARASRCTGASLRAGTGGRRIRSRCRPRRTGGGCASRSRTSATTRAGSRRCRSGRGSSSRGRRAG